MYVTRDPVKTTDQVVDPAPPPSDTAASDQWTPPHDWRIGIPKPNDSPLQLQRPSRMCGVNGALLRPAMRWADRLMDAGLAKMGFRWQDVPTTSGSVRLWIGEGRNPQLGTVIVEHGLGGCAAEHGDALRKLQDNFARVMFLEMPGHGHSTSLGHDAGQDPTLRMPVTLGVVDRLFDAVRTGLDAAMAARTQGNVLLLGHSLGGYVVSRYASEAGDGLAGCKLMLISPDGAPWKPDELREGRRMANVACHADALALAQRTWPQAPKTARWMTPFLWARFNSPEMRYLVNSDAFQPVLSPAELQRIRADVCLVWGRYEDFDPPHNLVYFDTHLPTYRLCRPDTGHGDFPRAHDGLIALAAQFAGDGAVGEQRNVS